VGVGFFMYALEASDAERFRLRDPVQTVGAYAGAVCITLRKGSDPHRLRITYAFTVPGFVRYRGDSGAPQPDERYTTTVDVIHPSRQACEAALPAANAARPPHPIWFERTEPHTARPSLQDPDSTRFLWLGLGALPLAGVGWTLARRART
jgi:hypothetical protein